MAALEASSSSNAVRAFHQVLGDGTREIVFKGITEAVIASAQFNDLLAPIQQVIRDFTQRAIASGERPDLSNFRDAILPLIEALSARRDLLQPILESLNIIGKDLNKSFDRLGGRGSGNITINIENYTNEDDPTILARRIGDLLNGRTAPPA
jgi:hypothetical protein